MAIPTNEKNLKLRASPAGSPMAAVTALENLKRGSKNSMVYSSGGGPKLPQGDILEFKQHLQGVSIYIYTGKNKNKRKDKHRNHAILSTSADDGMLIKGKAEVDGPNYIVHEKPFSFGHKSLHPGGIQVIGGYVVIPVYYRGYKGIEVRDIHDNFNLVNEINIPTNFKGPYAVGITTIGAGENERYIVAVVTDPDGLKVDVYTSSPGEKISDPACNFTRFGRYKHKPSDKNWKGYANNISLLSDTDDNIYLLGLYNTHLTGKGSDKAHLHLMELNDIEDKSKRVIFKRLRVFKAKRVHGSFRYGAGATVLDPSTIQIYSCEFNPEEDTSLRMYVIDCDLYNIG